MMSLPVNSPNPTRTWGELRITAARSDGFSSPLGSRTRSFSASMAGVPPAPCCQPPYQASITAQITTYAIGPAGYPESRFISDDSADLWEGHEEKKQ